MAESNKNNSQDLNNPEYWESLGIKPIVIDPNDEKDIEEKGNELAERIKDAVEKIRKEDKE